jgi:hypothetical protein
MFDHSSIAETDSPSSTRGLPYLFDHSSIAETDSPSSTRGLPYLPTLDS